MGVNIANIGNALTVVPDDALIYVAEPGGSNPDPYQDATVTATLLKAPLQSQIDDNETDIIDHESRITTLESLISKVHIATSSASFTTTQDADSLLIEIGFLVLSGSPTVAVGTSVGLGDIMSSVAITGGSRINKYLLYQPTNRTIYVTVSGGSVATTLIYRTEYFNQ